MSNLNQSPRPAIPGSMNNEQNRVPRDPLRDLPPKSPGTRRLIPTIPTKAKRGEVRFYLACEYVRS
jgi:hypothetical protein